ncbi:hypothetical protein NQD34_010472 [Periophthalmus magnuspinnatus]|nr:hypothetical protein NQD34_010472 [Periophthalmus magnuspinnatus]
MWKIQVSDKEKSMHSLHTSQHPRTFFLSLPPSSLLPPLSLSPSFSPPLSRSLPSLFFSMKLFHTDDTHLRSSSVPPTRRRLKFISLTPDKPPPSSHAQEAERLGRNQSYGPLSRQGAKRHRYRHILIHIESGCTHTQNALRSPR